MDVVGLTNGATSRVLGFLGVSGSSMVLFMRAVSGLSAHPCTLTATSAGHSLQPLGIA